MTTELSETDLFSDYAELLEDIDATKEEATDRMIELFETMVTNYTAEYIQRIFKLNLVANEAKYQDIVRFFQANYHPFDEYVREEDYNAERTPNLKSASVSSGTGTADTQRKQTQTQTTTPGTTTTTTHDVQPYDVTGLRTETKDTSEESGSTSTSTSDSGAPDHTSTSSSASSTVSTTGSEATEYTRSIHGRNGARPQSEIIADGFKAAAMHDVLDVILQDLADQIFLQTWTPIF